MNWRERLEGENTLEEDLFALFEDLKNSGPRGNNRVKQVRHRQSSPLTLLNYHQMSNIRMNSNIEQMSFNMPQCKIFSLV